MAKKSVKARNKKRKLLVEKYQPERLRLKAIIKNRDSSEEDILEAERKLHLLPSNSNPTRIKNRCELSGRPKGYMRRFGLSRLTFRDLARDGALPGVTKSSW